MEREHKPEAQSALVRQLPATQTLPKDVCDQPKLWPLHEQTPVSPQSVSVWQASSEHWPPTQTGETLPAVNVTVQSAAV
jgi:hypothetical protein